MACPLHRADSSPPGNARVSGTAGANAYRPPMPVLASGRVPALSLLWAVLFNPLQVWRQQHFEETLVVERTPLGKRLVISDPDLIRWILVDNARNYVRDSLQQRLLHRVTGRSLFLVEGKEWQLQRKILAPHFAARTLDRHLAGMAAAAKDAVDRFLALGDESFDLEREMWTLTVDVLARTLFSGLLTESPAAVADNLSRFSNTNGPVEIGDLLGLPPWLPGIRRISGWRATAQARQRARRILDATVAAGGAPGAGFLAALLAARHEESGAAISDRVIRDNISTILGAGSDTAAVTLGWALFLLSQVPHVRAAVEAEVDAWTDDAVPTQESLDKLVWTRATIEETMRLFPPAPMIGRMSLGEDILNGSRYPAGTTVLIVPWVLHRHASIWSDPDVFVPERFLPERRELIPRYGYLPFGAGPRVCLGMGFAMQEAIVVLATLIKHLRIERADCQPVRLRHCITLRSANPLRMRASPRQPS